MKLLHVDSSILGENSVSRSLSGATVERLQSEIPGLEVTYRDLVAAPIAHLTAHHLAGPDQDPPSDQMLRDDLKAGGAALDEFLAADIVVIGVGFYNFSIPSQLKAWIDRIAARGKTFRYTAAGPEGLAGGKRVILTIARGGFYGAGTPIASFEHAETYLRTVFGFLGITDIEVIAAEGINVGPEQREKATNDALAAIESLKAA
ncbi:FMN-dependent NADH-azoreductase [Jiella sonneratiae]|uniref:FMN dependent NADH:quinone oxidoreductase n=1 Tax=Jiella sonneratiae TaxID=2816856 RepID=A0ABS3J268_9HYPH|nr:FMN-dependent NADH-azoreductase [Jiella sonneratiae]MBO0903187.1 FMN-dependent NADH-azoreductase [Jiella sonneratiae]